MSNYNTSKEYAEEKKKFGKRLQAFRTEKGLSQNQLAEMFGVGNQTVSNWEAGYNFPKTVDMILQMADYFHCDPDYLIGRLDDTTHDIKFVHEYTGLSEKAIKKIRMPDLNHPFGKVLSQMIEAKRFENLITSYQIFITFLKDLEAEDLGDNHPWFSLDKGKITLGRNQAVNHFKQEVTFAMNNVCEDNYFEQVSNLGDFPDTMAMTYGSGLISIKIPLDEDNDKSEE